ncbi:hypothetical protein TIFTF001_033279 [Ficus carica]|uniref:Uncharacterized protein n=1 Tax=Ficus carica TaxID=3494 RepID=A0AA88J7G0_FICCA|nr:hypothetical protein TIFTF001_033279 [Ficus carica]
MKSQGIECSDAFQICDCPYTGLFVKEFSAISGKVMQWPKSPSSPASPSRPAPPAISSKPLVSTATLACRWLSCSGGAWTRPLPWTN